jgi:hypothetical protein
MISDEQKRVVKDRILDKDSFVRAVFSGRQRGRALPWQRVEVRPVLVKGKRHIQFSHFDAQKDISKNYAGAAAIEKLDELLALPFRSITLQTTDSDIQIQVTKKGKVIVHQHKAPEHRELPDLAHDRRKNLLLPVDKPDSFLQNIGIITKQGKVRASMRAKFRQINEFLERLVETGELEKFDRYPLTVVDCGCGSADLTFAVYHYLSHVLGMPTHLTGIDVNKELLRRRAEESRALGWDDLTFQAVRIIDFQPVAPPDIVLALHACDTATDEALAQGITWQSRVILSAPCCHHHLQQQLAKESPPPQFKPVLQHGVLRERLGDILTDTFRSLILQIFGYRTDVVEFVSTEHTGKNLMIRAVRSGKPGNGQVIQEYRDLQRFWQVTPYLEQLLEAELRPLEQDPE